MAANGTESHPARATATDEDASDAALSETDDSADAGEASSRAHQADRSADEAARRLAVVNR